MPIFQIELDDGRKLRIDADSQEAALAGVKHFQGGGKQKPPGEQPSVAADVAKSTAIAVPQTAIGLAGLPGTVSDLVGRGVNSLGNLATGKSGSYEDFQKKRAAALGGADITAPTTEAIKDTVEGVTGPLYTPKTTQGAIANAATGSALTAMLFPGKAAANALLGAASGATGESAGQVADVYAPKAAPAVRIGTEILTGGVGAAAIPNRLTRKATSAAKPSIENLGAGADKAYGGVKDLGVTYDPTAIHKGISGIARSLEDDYGSNIPNTLKLLTEREAKYAPGPPHPALDPRPAPAGKAPVSTDELETLRKQLGRPAKDPTEGLAAREAQGKLDDLLSGIDPAHVVTGDAKEASRLYGEARDYYSAKKRAEIIAGRLDLGDLNRQKGGTGGNVNSDRQAFGTLVRPDIKGNIPAKRFGFNEPEIDQFNKVARGTGVENFFRKAGTNTINHGLVGGGGLLEYYRTGDPRWLIPYAGTTAFRALAKDFTKRQARIADEMVRSRSPQGLWQVTPPPQRLGAGMTGSLLGLSAAQRQQLLDDEQGD